MKLPFGGGYNPEQWPEEVWDDDYRLFDAARIDTLTVGVFSWTLTQPAPDTYDFSMLDRIVERAAAEGRSICLATGTGAMPAWLAPAFPEVTRLDFEGRRHRYGGRHNHCPSGPVFRRMSAEVAGRIAERYAGNPAVVAWHVGNEYGGACYCELCAAAFHDWLRRRYDTLERLNAAWYTRFWSHTFTDWAQIEPPSALTEHWKGRAGDDQLHGDVSAHRLSPLGRAPGLRLLGQLSARRPVTGLDGAEPRHHARAQGRATVLADGADAERHRLPGRQPAQAARDHAAVELAGGRARGRRGAVLPDAGVTRGQREVPRSGHRPRRARRQPASSAKWPRWGPSWRRSARPHSGPGRRRGWRCCSTGTAGGRWRSPTGRRVCCAIRRWCTPTTGRRGRPGVDVDVIPISADILAYDVVVAPVLHMIKGDLAERLEEVATRGGSVVTTFLSGRVDEDDNAFPMDVPGPLGPLMGVRVDEWDAREAGVVNPVRLGDIEVKSRLIFELLTPTTAEVAGSYLADFYAGTPAVTRNAFGEGQGWYVGTGLDQEGVAWVLHQVLDRHGPAHRRRHHSRRSRDSSSLRRAGAPRRFPI